MIYLLKMMFSFFYGVHQTSGIHPAVITVKPFKHPPFHEITRDIFREYWEYPWYFSGADARKKKPSNGATQTQWREPNWSSLMMKSWWCKNSSPHCPWRILFRCCEKNGVPWIPSRLTPVMLAYIPAPAGSVIWSVMGWISGVNR